MQAKPVYLAFNRGLVSRHALARTDVKRLAMSAETMVNFMPMVLGPMYIRPGLKYIGELPVSQKARLIPFVFSATQTALIELTDNIMRVWDDETLITRESVSTEIDNGTFVDDLGSWTDDNDVVGGVWSNWVPGGYMVFVGQEEAYAKRYQKVTVSGADIGKTHALNIIVDRGPVILRVGTMYENDDLISETALDAGYHSLAFEPSMDFYVQFKSSLKRRVSVQRCTIATAGAMEIETPWSGDDLDNIRYEQSGDVMFIGCKGRQQYMIERRGDESWSCVKYLPEDGPFQVENIGTVKLEPAVIDGNGSLTASEPFFKPEHVGALFAVQSIGQVVEETVTGDGDFSDSIKVVGSRSKTSGTKKAEERLFNITITGLTGTGTTITLQRSYFDEGSWVDVRKKSWTEDITDEEYQDKFDNQVVYYRIGAKTGDYASGSPVVTLEYASGSIRGICRVTAYANTQSVDIEVLRSFGGYDPTTVWEEGTWSELEGFPNVPKLHDGRLWWFGKDKIWGSISDGFLSFDHEVEGDSGTIARSIGRGPIDTFEWGMSLNRLLLGGEMNEYSCKSSSLDEPMTPTNFGIRALGGQGSAAVQAMEIDNRGIFVQRSGNRVYGMGMSTESYDYQNEHLSALVPEIGEPGITRMGVQRQPDTRIHFVRSDGTVALLVFDPVENVTSWSEIETDGTIDDVAVLPSIDNDTEDRVYYLVTRSYGNAAEPTETMLYELTSGSGGESVPYANGFLWYPDGAVLWKLDKEDGTVYGSMTTPSGRSIYHPAYADATHIWGFNSLYSKIFKMPQDMSVITEFTAACTYGITMDYNTTNIWRHPNDHTAVLIDKATGADVETRDMVDGMYGWTVDADGTLWAVRNLDNNFELYKHDGASASHTTIASLPAGDSLISLCYDTDRDSLWIFTETKILEYSIATATTTERADATNPVSGLALNYSAMMIPIYDSGRGLVWFSDWQARNFLLGFNTTTFEFTQYFEMFLVTSPSGPVSFDDEALYYSDALATSGNYAAMRYEFANNVVSDRFLEKMARHDQCLGEDESRLADAYVVYDGDATTSITGLDHLEAQEVVVWADGADVGTDTDGTLIYTVEDGAITLATAASNVVVGRPYTAQWKSGKLVQIQDQLGTGLKHEKNIKGLGLILADAHYKGLQFGRDFDNLDDMPSIEDGTPVTADTVHTAYDTEMIVFPGTWGIDERLCLQAKAPRPVTVIAAICEAEHHG